jgi:ABC-type transport system involved in multi-copper enzyme maturation permease subunit
VARTDVTLLFWKEVRQLTRNQSAMLTGLFLPATLVVLAPVLALLASRTPGYRSVKVPDLTARLPGFSDIHGAQDFFLYVTIPVLIVVAALLTPTLTAAHVLVTERERRSLELLLALPVTVGDVLAAKLIANAATAVASMVPMFFVDAIVIMFLTGMGPLYIGLSLALLLSTLVAATGGCLLLALVARDMRTATYLSASIAVPGMVVTALAIVFSPGLLRFPVLALLMLALGGTAFYAGTRWLTLERYLT